MKKIMTLTLALISVFALSVWSHASYIIHLKGGGQYITSQYWEEDGQIKFSVHGGTMGIDKDTVQKIEKSNLSPDESNEMTKPEKVSPEVDLKQEKEIKKDAIAPGSAATEKNATAKDDAKKDPAIMGELMTLKNKFESKESLSVDELIDLKDDLTILRDKIFSNRLKYDYLEEANNVAEMRFLVNKLLIIKSKKQ